MEQVYSGGRYFSSLLDVQRARGEPIGIPVERCAHHFGMGADEAKRAAARQALPVPAFRLGSQKSPWLVSADELAKHIDAKKEVAAAEWKRINAA